MRNRKIFVDVKALQSIDHSCKGCTDAEDCCCAQFDICITEDEMEALVGLLPELVTWCPWLAEEDGFRNVFEETDDGLYSIDTHETGLCMFAYAGQEGIRCSVHTVADAFNIPLEQVKPSSCILWPLAISEPHADQLSICGDALLFHCNTACVETGKDISPDLLDSIEHIYGPGVRETIRSAAYEGRQGIAVALQHRRAGSD